MPVFVIAKADFVVLVDVSDVLRDGRAGRLVRGRVFWGLASPEAA